MNESEKKLISIGGVTFDPNEVVAFNREHHSLGMKFIRIYLKDGRTIDTGGFYNSPSKGTLELGIEYIFNKLNEALKAEMIARGNYL